MAGITLEQANEKLQTWLEAEEEIASGQEYEIGNRRLRRADLQFVRETVDYWDKKAKALARGGISVKGITAY